MLSKQQIEEKLHRHLLWHEFTEKGRYIDGGFFADAGGIEIANNHNAPRAFVSCAGTKGMTCISEFSDSQMCKRCKERKSPFVSCAIYGGDRRSKGADLISASYDKSFSFNAVVPFGCPHVQEETDPEENRPISDNRAFQEEMERIFALASTSPNAPFGADETESSDIEEDVVPFDDVAYDEESRDKRKHTSLIDPASSSSSSDDGEDDMDPMWNSFDFERRCLVRLNSAGKSTPIPHSWKLYENEKKITLAVQYERDYVHYNKSCTAPIVSREYLYVNFCCNIENGQTFVSDMHPVAFKRHNKSAPMENISSTGSSMFLLNLPKNNRLGVPITKMFVALASKLNRLGILDDGEIARAIESAGGYRYMITSPYNVLAKIALINRFPHLDAYPLTDHKRQHFAPYLRRRMDRLPRDVRNDTLLCALKLEQTEALSSLVKESAEKVSLACMMDEWGYSAQEIEEEAKSKFSNVRKQLDVLSVQQNPKHLHTYEKFDMYSIAIPTVLSGPFALADYGDFNLRYTRLHLISSLFDFLLGDSNGRITQKRSEYVEEISKPFTKGKRRWKMNAMQSPPFDTGNPHFASAVSMSLSEKPSKSSKISDEPLKDTEIELSLKMYLDRRAWNKAQARRYLAWLERCTCALSDIEEEKSLVEDIVGDTISPKQALSLLPDALKEERESIAERFLSAVRFSPELIQVHLISSKGRMPEEAVPSIFEWAYRNNIDITRYAQHQLSTVCDISKLKKSIEDRIERRRAKKRKKKDAETKK